MMQRSSGQTLGALKMVRVDGEGLRVFGWLHGLPTGVHEIRIHAVGLCEPPAFTSAGPRYASPSGGVAGTATAGSTTGAPQVVVDTEENARVDVTFPMALLDVKPGAGMWDADGSALVVYTASDDARNVAPHDPQARIACGVIPSLRGP